MVNKAADANTLVHASRASTTSMYTFFLSLPLGFRFVPMEALSDATIQETSTEYLTGVQVVFGLAVYKFILFSSQYPD
ncbi:hypothetical protein C8R41DRAFT_289754 [Lentinula lateritia]|uniref:Uncharacterized protein n=1 Tax=Lentinula lateritia TaxID=40482 RepID=A0ABQ8VI81_9AGAR|nr:hypothetical protein C8R41DRAFT_289754 [Lentinula lateritia]